MTTVEAPRRRRRLRSSVWFHVALALALALVIVASIGQPSSGSMSPTLEPGDRILVNRLAYVAADPAVGDIIVFRPGEGWDADAPSARGWFSESLHWIGETTGIRPEVLVKRVIAETGQTVECCDADGAVLVDGQPLDEPYVVDDLPFSPGELDCGTTPTSTRCFAEVTVPESAYLVLGDNRGNSADSAYRCRGDATAGPECWRWVDRASVVGKATAVLWPLSRWNGL
ncbi:signal peptidase I [Microbacterium aurugineum]|uniref:signal peptidase I n=1 Tax=Microbacterium aurugineum TaxID=2851642 RepID=UPI0039BDC739